MIGASERFNASFSAPLIPLIMTYSRILEDKTSEVPSIFQAFSLIFFDSFDPFLQGAETPRTYIEIWDIFEV